MFHFKIFSLQHIVLGVLVLSLCSCRTGYDLIEVGDLSVLPVKRQEKVALHEAAHALARAHYFDVDTVTQVRVYVLCCGEDMKNYLGEVNLVNKKKYSTISDEHNSMVEAFAGRVADEVFTNHKVTGSIQDMKNARKHAWRIILLYPGADGKIPAYTRKTAPEDAKKRAEAEYEDAQKHAGEFVRANKALIRDLASHLMQQKVSERTRNLSGAAFRAFMKGKSTVDPRKKITRTH